MHLPPDATPSGTSCHHTHQNPFSAKPSTAARLRPTMSPPVLGWIHPDSPGAQADGASRGLSHGGLAQPPSPGLAPRSHLALLRAAVVGV